MSNIGKEQKVWPLKTYEVQEDMALEVEEKISYLLFYSKIHRKKEEVTTITIWMVSNSQVNMDNPFLEEGVRICSIEGKDFSSNVVIVVV